MHLKLVQRAVCTWEGAELRCSKACSVLYLGWQPYRLAVIHAGSRTCWHHTNPLPRCLQAQGRVFYIEQDRFAHKGLLRALSPRNPMEEALQQAARLQQEQE